MPSRLDEATAASQAYQLALAQIGVETLQEALAIWRQQEPDERGQTAALWLATATALILARRGQARALAFAYYRLARALVTGSTIARPGDQSPGTVTMGDLRREFARLIGDPSNPEPVERTTVSEPVTATPIPEPDSIDLNEEVPDAAPVAEEPLATGSPERDEGGSDDLALDQDSQDQADVAVEEEIAEALINLGPANLAKKNRQIDTTKPADEVDAKRRENARQAGARQAASAARITMNAGRKQVFELQKVDPKALGWIRVSTTGTPCGFCAMLISRGPVYKSEASAGFGDGNLFHDNCYCTAIPVWSDEQYNDDPQFALNRLYSEQWPVVTRGLSGDAALSAWRRFIRQEQARKNPDAQAA